MSARHAFDALDHEELVVRTGPRSGVTIAVAIHSTVLGPALGGLRMHDYATPRLAVDDALRLARGMTLKAAAAGLDLGGGKGVICSPRAAGAARDAMLADFAEIVDELDGRYITAEDVGTDSADMLAIASRTAHVTGLPVGAGGSGDPSPFTALGVEAAIRACATELRGARDLRGLGVVVVGLGHVGARLATRLAEVGARLSVSDIDPVKQALANRLDARWVEPEAALATPCDVLVPCALGGVINPDSLPGLDTEIICGAANNQLADERLAEELAARRILYAPDFIANAGGLISCFGEIAEQDEDWAYEQTLAIEATMGRILATAGERDLTPLAAAHELAAERLHGVVRN